MHRNKTVFTVMMDLNENNRGVHFSYTVMLGCIPGCFLHHDKTFQVLKHLQVLDAVATSLTC